MAVVLCDPASMANSLATLSLQGFSSFVHPGMGSCAVPRRENLPSLIVLTKFLEKTLIVLVGSCDHLRAKTQGPVMEETVARRWNHIGSHPQVNKGRERNLAKKE